MSRARNAPGPDPAPSGTGTRDASAGPFASARLAATLWRGISRPFRRSAPPAQAASASPVHEPSELVPVGGGAEAAGPAAAGRAGEDRNDARVLPYVLLHRSRMHAVDLRRALDGFRAADGTLALRPGEVRSLLAYQLDVLMQVAVELVLDGREVREELAAEPESRQRLHDAVYYVSRRWREAQPVDFSEPGGRAAFDGYILERMNDAFPGGEDEPFPPPSSDDLAFLFEQAQTVARLASDRFELRRRFDAEWRGHGDEEENEVTKRLLYGVMGLDGTIDPPLFRIDDGPYQWRYDRSGRPRPLPQGAEPPDAEGDPLPDAQFVSAARRELARVVKGGGGGAQSHPVSLGTLASDFHVLAAVPAWSEVERAMGLLLQPEGPVGADRRALGPVVRQYAQMLRERADVLALALLAGAAVGQAAPAGPEERLSRGLGVLAEAHRFASLALPALREALRQLREGLHRVVPVAVRDPPLPPLAREADVVGWMHKVEEAMARVRAVEIDVDALRPDAALSAQRRVSAFVASGAREEPRIEELVVITAGSDEPSTLRLNLAAMTISAWSAQAFSSLVAAGREPWEGLAALAALGFRAPGWPAFAEWLKTARFLSSSPAPALDLHALPAGEPAPGARAVLIVRRSGDSLTREWMPSPAIPALVLTADEARTALTRLSRRGTPLPPLLPPLARIAFEMPLDARDVDEELLKLLRQRLSFDAREGDRVVYLYAEQPQEQAKHPYIPAPHGLDDLLQPAR